MKNVIYFLLVFFICSCSSLSEKIDIKTIDKVVEKIKKDNPKLDSAKINVLDRLNAIAKGRDAYIKFLNSGYFDKYVADEKQFNEVRDNLFNYFKAEKITYNSIFVEMDSAKAINTRLQSENIDLIKKIDAFCSKKQKEMDLKEAKFAILKDSLNKMIQIKLISIQTTERDYRDVVQVKIQIINTYNKPLEAISFKLELFDKLGNSVATLNCKSNDRIVKSDYGFWVYDKWENSEVYKGLKDMRIEHVSTKQTIRKININGDIVSTEEEPDLDNYLANINYKYESPKELTGYCPYLSKTDELYIKMTAVDDKIKKEVEKQTPIITKYGEITNKLLDFSK